MPIVPVSMTSESYNHARMIADKVVSVKMTGTTPTSTTLDLGSGSLVGALHEIVAGATLTSDVLAGTTRTITIELGAAYDAMMKTQLDVELANCLASITAAEQTIPGLVLKV